MKNKKTLKKIQVKTILKIPGHVHIDSVLVWLQVETRFGQRNTTIRAWPKKGTCLRVVQQQQFEYVYVFGAVCINTGETEALIYLMSNVDAMVKHLKLISDAAPAGKHPAVISDKASWYQHYLVEPLPNLSIKHILPYSAELNSIEQVWSWLRQHELANRCFEHYEDIVTSVERAWNHFREDTDRVMSLCYRSWTKLPN